MQPFCLAAFDYYLSKFNRRMHNEAVNLKDVQMLEYSFH